MLQHRSDRVQIEIAGDHHQWLVTVRDQSGARRTYTFHAYHEVIEVVLEELARYWAAEGEIT